MAASGMIVVAQRCEGTESMGQVVEVSVVQRDRPGSTVETGSREDTVREVMCEVGVSFEELRQVLG